MRKCPRCHKEMKEDCYLIDNSKQLSDYIVIEKDENLKKVAHPLKVAVCPVCGYVEFYVEPKKEEVL